MTKRQIKFRAWDTQTLFFKNEDLTIHNGVVGGTYRHPIVIQQFTGLLDKNGKEIYEGDIVKREGGVMYPELLLTVFWNDKVASFQVGDWTIGHFLSDNEVEIIGNIYENPNLLK